MKLECVQFRSPGEWEIPQEKQDTIKTWMQEEHYPFKYRNVTMAHIWFLSAMVGFAKRERGKEQGRRIKSVPCHVFSDEQVLCLRLAGCRLLDDNYHSFLRDREIYDVLFPYMLGGLSILDNLFRNTTPTYYQQTLAQMVLETRTPSRSE